MTKTIPFFDHRSLSRAYRRVFLVCFFAAFIMIFLPVLLMTFEVNKSAIMLILFISVIVAHFIGDKSESYLDDQKGASQIERRRPFTETKEFVEWALTFGVGVALILVLFCGVIASFLI